MKDDQFQIVFQLERVKDWNEIHEAFRRREGSCSGGAGVWIVEHLIAILE